MQENRKALGMLLIGLFFGTGLGYLLATPPGAVHDHSDHDHLAAPVAVVGQPSAAGAEPEHLR